MKVVNGIEDLDGLDEMEYWQAVVMDSAMRSIVCPNCKDSFNVEPDAEYTVECDCGVKVKVPEPLV